MVCELINPESKWWKVSLLEPIFIKDGVENFLSIPISVSNQPDRCIWRGTSNVFFTMKRAYYMHKENEALELARSSRRGKHRSIWKTLWALQIPNAEKKFPLEGLQRNFAYSVKFMSEEFNQ